MNENRKPTFITRNFGEVADIVLSQEAGIENIEDGLVKL
jgi:hypothetical protein